MKTQSTSKAIKISTSLNHPHKKKNQHRFANPVTQREAVAKLRRLINENRKAQTTHLSAFPGSPASPEQGSSQTGPCLSCPRNYLQKHLQNLQLALPRAGGAPSLEVPKAVDGPWAAQAGGTQPTTGVGTGWSSNPTQANP